MSLTFGIDPGSRAVGVSMFDGSDLVEFAVLKTKASLPPLERIMNLSTAVQDWIGDRSGSQSSRAASTIVLETPGVQSTGRSGRAMITMGMAVGSIHDRVAFTEAYRVVLYPVAEWATMGYGGRPLPKTRRAEIIAERFPAYAGAEDKGLDAADAIGVVFFHFWKENPLAYA